MKNNSLKILLSNFMTHVKVLQVGETRS